MAAALLVVAAVHGFLLLGQKEIVGRDAHRLFHPAAHALQRRLERLELPEWEPAIACGQPLVGLGQSQAFYPPRWLQLATGPDRVFSLLGPLHALAAALAAFLLARRLGRSAPASAVAATVTGAAPLLFSALDSPNLHYSACWIPVALYLGVS
ncbi:MAG: hypothetical protein HY901_37570, partial [Deltaproteobacteria bacterium]|nr:hypothetical protein [Deltaproteobacteria bacterium]